MSGDLISREALRKALKSNCDSCHDKNTNWCEHCCPLNDFEDLIDNAPTVTERPQIIGCFNCKHEKKMSIEEPCRYCNVKYSKWEEKGGAE